jgi:predicted Zn-dependent protease
MKKKPRIIALLFLLLFAQSKAYSLELPPFLPDYFTPAFEVHGQKLSLANHSVKDGVEQYLYFTNDKALALLVENIKCDRPRNASILNYVATNLNDAMKSTRGEFLHISPKDIHAQIFDNDKVKTVFAYSLPSGVQIWTFVMKSIGEYHVDSHFKMIRNVVNKQRYNQALLEGNVAMGFWGDEIYEYAKKLLHDGRKKDGLDVLEKLLPTSPYNYAAHMDFAENTTNPEAAAASLKTVLKGSENPALTAKAARLSGTKLLSFDSIPFLSRGERGLQVILLPLEPCDTSLLEDISKTYRKITGIPVKIRRIREKWNLSAPDRIPYQRVIQETLVKSNGLDINFTGWGKDRYLDELKKNADKEEPLKRYYIRDIVSRVEKEAGQYSADKYLNRFLDILEAYRSNDQRTMYVGITGMNIYSGDSNYVFSLYVERQNKCRASILSYYMMKADTLSEEYESRNRLTERTAKELVPASIKSLNIPRSTDPSCPYSYSSGVSRLDQKSLVLSEEVKNTIERFKSQQAKPSDTRSLHR